MKLPQSPLSLWLAEYGPYEPNPPLRGDASVEVAIVGGGFTGVATANALKKAAPDQSVALLEHEVVGFGASGRNGSFSMTVVGLGFGVMAKLKGKAFVKDAHRYMERAVDGLEALIEEDGLDCDYTRPGFLRMATSPYYAKHLQREVELVKSLGIEGLDWIDAKEARTKVDSPHYLGAMWEPRLGLLNPAKLVREQKRTAVERGVAVYEGTPVESIERGAKFKLRTPEGTVTADRIVLATNAYSQFIPELSRKQSPAWTYMVATEPLSDRHFEAIRWQERNGVEDARNLIHYYRITPDNRLVMGGGPVGLGFGKSLEHDSCVSAWRHLEEHIRFLFPVLEDVKTTHRWGGPFSVTLDLTPALGYLGDPRAVFSLGCTGHGVSMAHQNAQTLVDLLLERDSENMACPFVNRKVHSWPPEPLRFMATKAMLGYLGFEDWLHDRKRQPVS